MGWCSATQIMGTVLRTALGEVEPFIKGVSAEHLCCYNPAEAPLAAEVLLRPMVRSLAEQLRAEDWDCVSDSVYYERFGPELRGMTDDEFREYQARHYQDDPEGFASWLKVWEAQHRGR